jgi:hypothetical protein
MAGKMPWTLRPCRSTRLVCEPVVKALAIPGDRRDESPSVCAAVSRLPQLWHQVCDAEE